MSNFGLLSRSVGGGGKKDTTAVWKHSFPKDKTFHIIPLMCPFIPLADQEEQDKKGPIPVAFRSHFEQGANSSLCNKIYSDNTGCERCEETNSFGGQNFPSTGLTFAGYVLELVGAPAKMSKKGNEYNESPEKVIEIPKGKKFINWAELREAYDEPLLDAKGKPAKFKSKEEEDKAREERFLNTIFRIKKIDGGWSIKVIDRAKLGDQADVEVPQELRDKYEHMTIGAKIGVCAAVYSNVRWSHPDIAGEGIVPPAKPVEEGETSGGESEINLNEDPLDEYEDDD